MTITFNAPKTKVVEEAPASITMTVSLEQFAKLRALAGQVRLGQLGNLFDSLEAATAAHKIPRYRVQNPASIPPIYFEESN